MNFEITCNHCKQSFRLDNKHIHQKTTIQCPNCEEVFSDELLNQLKGIATSLEKVAIRSKDKVSVKLELGINKPGRLDSISKETIGI
ncbi:hypothetical protein ACTFRP_19495 [Bacillus cereus group sp. MYBK234-1]|uniref:hypothetical protein n=1 Tax=unclassified Bacillus cereus group TaxID=2750818 RepID=UPI003F790691